MELSQKELEQYEQELKEQDALLKFMNDEIEPGLNKTDNYKTVLNLFFINLAIFIIICLVVLADKGEYKAFSVLILALVVNGYVLYYINKEWLIIKLKWTRKH